jgi:hypothetical protein
MAKVKGGLFSLEASGQVGGSIVFSKWKGQAYVRALVTPLNKMSADQGDNRMILGGIGRAVAEVKAGSDYDVMLRTIVTIPAGQSKQSYLVQRIKALYMVDATAFEAQYTAFEAHTGKTAFTADAIVLGLTDLNIDYKGTTHFFSKGMMLYLIAKYAINESFTGAPYSTALASWTATQTALLVTALAAPTP